MKNNTNHTIAKIFNELSNGHSIELDYSNRQYTFTRQNDNEMLLSFECEIMGHFRVEQDRTNITFVFWDLSKPRDPNYPVNDLKQLDGLGTYLQFDVIIEERNED